MTDTATTILQQLGGNRFLAMTGARQLLNTGDGLQFSLPRGAVNKANKVRITLTQRDDYRVEFLRYSPRTLECTTLSQDDGVYAENLRQVFTSRTGLDCTL